MQKIIQNLTILTILLALLIFPFNFTKDGRLVAPRRALALSWDNLADTSACANFSKEKVQIKTYGYMLNGQPSQVSTTMYPDLAKCLDKLKRDTSLPKAPHAIQEDTDDALMINNIPQTENLKELAQNIENVTPDKNDQVRIAVSMVQGFKYEDKDPDDYQYPYAVAFDQKGICNETAKLLLNLLKQLGIDSAMLTFEKDNHQAVGIKCDPQYSFQNTGYCFVETTSRAIITDNVEENNPVRVNKISDGLTFDASNDFAEAQSYIDSIDKKVKSAEDKDIISSLKAKYGIG